MSGDSKGYGRWEFYTLLVFVGVAVLDQVFGWGVLKALLAFFIGILREGKEVLRP